MTTPAESGADASGVPAGGGDTVGWTAADFPNPERGVWPPEWEDRRFFMARVGKRPFAPWGDRNAPVGCSKSACVAHDSADGDGFDLDCRACQQHRDDALTCAECGHDARFKWSVPDNWADKATVDEWVAKDPRLDGHVVLLEQEADPYTDDPDPYAFVDGDDVRCPETKEVHPGFVALLERLGLTYADVSQSSTGVHAPYRGTLPDGYDTVSFTLDTEPWGANDDPPSVEIYDGKRVCVATGQHVPGTPLEVCPWDADALEAIVAEHTDTQDRHEPAAVDGHDTDRERADLVDYEPNVTTADEQTDDPRDVLVAVDRLCPADLPLRTRQVGHDSTGWEQWDPSTYRASRGNDSLHRPPGEAVFHDFKTGHSFGVLHLFAAEQGIIQKPWYRLRGADWWDAVDTAREAGAPIPEYVGSDGVRAGDPHPTLPDALLTRLDVLAPQEQRRAARKRGLEWPTTREVRRRLADSVQTAMHAGDMCVKDAPTAAGKTHTVATEPWLDRPDMTGGAPVVHLHETREAREQAASASAASDRVTHTVLRGRDELCPIARGDHDPPDDPDNELPDRVLTVGSVPASEWLANQCDEKGVPFSVAHAYLAEYNDQGAAPPCCADSAECPARTQWDGLPRNDDGNPAVDVIHTTHEFARVPSLRANTNLVLDEQPDYRADLTHDRIRRAITAFLHDADSPVATFEQFVTLARFADYSTPSDTSVERDAVRGVLDHTPDQDWYIEHPDAHALAPALARALWHALGDDDGQDQNGRYSATVTHNSPRFDDGQQWDHEYVKVVVGANNTVRDVWCVPDFSTARSVIGLDAHPSAPLWALNVHPAITTDAVLDTDERRLWRRYERGLTIVQLGDATRPVTTGEYFDPDHCAATARAVATFAREHGHDLCTGTTGKSVKPRVRRAYHEAGIADPDLIHIGEEKSRNDFAGEQVGLHYGAIDPGDDYLCDALAALGLDATPEHEPCGHCDGTGQCPDDGNCHLPNEACEPDDSTCGPCNGTGDHRAKGRGFTGSDADAAAAVLASVREHRVAQCAGRYARNADDPDDGAVVFVATDAVPDGFADVTTPGVPRLATDTQRDIYDALCATTTATTREVADAAGVSKEYARQTLQQFADRGLALRREHAGSHGADTYRATDPTADLDAGGADLGENDPAVQTANSRVWGLSTWELAVCDRDAAKRTVALASPGRTGVKPPPHENDSPSPTVD